MNLNITGHHVAVTEALRSYTVSKLERVKRHFDQVIDVNVVMSVEKLRQKVDATIHVSGRDIHAASEGDSLYAAIDKMADQLDRQIVKHKEKLQTGRGSEAAARKRSDVETDTSTTLI